MPIACFMRSVDMVENLGSDLFRITVSCNLMDSSNSTFQTQFDAQKGADWRIQARDAVRTAALSQLGETVDVVIMPGLESL